MSDPKPFQPRDRFQYACDAIAAIEDDNCWKGCTQGDLDNDDGPGGTCPILINVLLEKPATELVDDGQRITCRNFTPITVTGLADQPALW